MPPQSARRGSGYFQAQVDPKSLRRVERYLREVDPKVRKRIARDAMRGWGKTVRNAARRFTHPNSKRTRRQLTYKVRAYKRAVWAAVGVKAERVKNTRPEQRLGRKSPFVGWKSHFFEVGWHAWPKGKSGTTVRAEALARNYRVQSGKERIITYTRKLYGKVITQGTRERKVTLSEGSSTAPGKGWRRGLRGHKGRYLTMYAVHYLYRGAQVGRNLAPTLVLHAIREGVKDARRAA